MEILLYPSISSSSWLFSLFSAFTGTGKLAPTKEPLKCHPSRNFLGQGCLASFTWNHSRQREAKPYLPGLPLSLVASGPRLPQPLGWAFSLESTLGSWNVPQDTEAGRGLHCEPCLAKSHREALGYSAGVAAQGERVHFPHHREAGQPGRPGTAWEPMAEEETGEQNSCISHCREIPAAQEDSGSKGLKSCRIRPKARAPAGGWANSTTRTPELAVASP